MDTAKVCQHCGKPLTSKAVQGLCAECFLKVGLGTEAGSGDPAAAKSNSFTPPDPTDLAPHFPQLEIVELLGKGGMGAVYKARQKGLDRLVALKVLPPESERTAAFAERFSREARALARLDHPNIVGVHDFGQAGGFYYFLMEFVDGVNLRQMLRAHRLSPREAMAIVPQVCEALQYAHDQGIVHRDIKPENVLVDKRGRVKIADFGLAKLLGKDPQREPLTRSAEVMGTPQYMAPEQFEKPLEVDHRADIYSLGVVFYEMLTGELPLGRFAAPSKKVQVDVRLDEIVLRALEKEPQLRYQQASVFKTELETIASASAQRPAVRVPGRRIVVPLIAIIVLLVVIPMAVILSKSPKQRAHAVVDATTSPETMPSPSTNPVTVAPPSDDRDSTPDYLRALGLLRVMEQTSEGPLEEAVNRQDRAAALRLGSQALAQMEQYNRLVRGTPAEIPQTLFQKFSTIMNALQKGNWEPLHAAFAGTNELSPYEIVWRDQLENLAEQQRISRSTNPEQLAKWASSGLSFSSTFERVINDVGTNSENSFLDLDTGNFIELGGFDGVPSKDVVRHVSLFLKSVVMSLGIDAQGNARERSLQVFDMVTMPVDSAKFDTLTPADLVTNSRLMSETERHDQTLTATKFPATWLFNTREGNVGILQIVAVKAGVTIRYKLARSAPGIVSRTFSLRHRFASDIADILQQSILYRQPATVKVSSNNLELIVSAPSVAMNRAVTFVTVQDWPEPIFGGEQSRMVTPGNAINAARLFFDECSMENDYVVSRLLSANLLARLKGTNLTEWGFMQTNAPDAPLIRELRADWPGKEAAVRRVIDAWNKYPLQRLKEDPGIAIGFIPRVFVSLWFEGTTNDSVQISFIHDPDGDANAPLVIDNLPPWFAP